MPDTLNEKIRAIGHNHQVTSLDQLDGYLQKFPEEIDALISLSEEDPCIYFSENSFDGWYCIGMPNRDQTYDIYWQERGSIDPSSRSVVQGKAKAAATMFYVYL